MEIRDTFAFAFFLFSYIGVSLKDSGKKSIKKSKFSGILQSVATNKPVVTEVIKKPLLLQEVYTLSNNRFKVVYIDEKNGNSFERIAIKPRFGFKRIEFSTENGELYSVKINGKMVLQTLGANDRYVAGKIVNCFVEAILQKTC